MTFRTAIANAALAVAVLAGGVGYLRADDDLIVMKVPGARTELASFLDYKIGMSRREFRVGLPSSWETAPEMWSHEHGFNSAGDYDPGYFSYSLRTKYRNYPMTFDFWRDRLAEATASVFIFGAPGEVSPYEIVDGILPKTVALYGKPAEQKNDEHWSLHWSADGIEVNVDAWNQDPSDRSTVGQVNIRLRDPISAAAMETFVAVPPPAETLTVERIALVHCKRQMPSGGWLELSISADTRQLRDEMSSLVAERKKSGLEASGYQCETEQWKLSGDSKQNLERTLAGYPIMDTYLRFTDADGIATVMLFHNAPTDLEDMLCDTFLAGLTSVAPDARCIVGNGLDFSR